MTDRDWDCIQIKNITMIENSDIVFINCASQDDARMFTSRAKNIPQENTDNSPCMVMYVDRRAAKRHKAFITIAKSIRNHSKNAIQTSIRVEKRDFLLRQRSRGLSNPWAEIPPLTITQQLPDFEIENYYDIVNPSNNMDEEVEEPMDKEQLEEIIKYLSRQNSEIGEVSKRERTQDNTLPKNKN